MAAYLCQRRLLVMALTALAFYTGILSAVLYNAAYHGQPDLRASLDRRDSDEDKDDEDKDDKDDEGSLWKAAGSPDTTEESETVESAGSALSPDEEGCLVKWDGDADMAGGPRDLTHLLSWPRPPAWPLQPSTTEELMAEYTGCRPLRRGRRLQRQGRQAKEEPREAEIGDLVDSAADDAEEEDGRLCRRLEPVSRAEAVSALVLDDHGQCLDDQRSQEILEPPAVREESYALTADAADSSACSSQARIQPNREELELSRLFASLALHPRPSQEARGGDVVL